MATWLITGANRGIGLEMCRQLADDGEAVVAACRSASNELREAGVEIIDGIDVSVGDDVESLASRLDGRPLDVLVNNAGILRSDSFDTIDYDAMLEQFRVNTLGPLRVTRALMPNLSRGSKLAIVSSRVGSIEDNGSGGNYGYRVSKTAVNMVGMNLRHDLYDRGIAVALLHPGLVATDMTGGRGISPADSARGLIARIAELDMGTTGTFWHAEGYVLPW
ncbi:MAG: SDR family oxidoreductase [Gammaproteobacteria bacterium]|nr:SDR family oxidoreductase [Gammaproteobacteria bacterium]